MPAQHMIEAPELERFLVAEGKREADELRSLAAAARAADDLGGAGLAEGILQHLPSAQPGRRARLLFLLGFLVHTGNGSAPLTRDAVRDGLDEYLRLLGSPGLTEQTRVALLYLLAQFPEDRAAIVGRASAAPLTDFEQSRLERCLARLDRTAPVLGRAWPAPAGWTLTESESAADLEWARGLDAARADFIWEKDTRTLLAYCGARAYAALSAPLDDETAEETAHGTGDGTTDRQPGAAATGPAADVDVALLRCPDCGGGFEGRLPRVRCRSCAAEFDSTAGFLDLSGVEAAGMDQIAGNSPLYLNTYERLLRPAFLRVTGDNWSDAVTVEDEDRFLVGQLRRTTGPVLDLAAGAGRWTSVMADSLGADRVIAMDLATAMVQRLRATLPAVAALRGSAENIPFADASLGAVSCWNALQSMADPALVVREIGRCLRPGGVLTLLTFTSSTDPVYRFFQNLHEECLTVRSFPADELLRMLTEAGLTVREQRLHGSLLMLTAVRGRRPGEAHA